MVALAREITGPDTTIVMTLDLHANISELFPGMKIVEAHPFHVTRDADFTIQEMEAADLLDIHDFIWTTLRPAASSHLGT